MDYYCRRYKFPSPDVDFICPKDRWEAIMTIDGRRMAWAPAQTRSLLKRYLDVTKYLESCDADLWKTYQEARKTGKDLGLAPKVLSQASHDISGLVDIIRHLALYKNRSTVLARALASTSGGAPGWRQSMTLAAKSSQLLARRKGYTTNPKLERMRLTRLALPVYIKANDVLTHIAEKSVAVCMAATGSGKTTQIPQMILDEYIDRGEGAN